MLKEASRVSLGAVHTHTHTHTHTSTFRKNKKGSKRGYSIWR